MRIWICVFLVYLAPWARVGAQPLRATIDSVYQQSMIPLYDAIAAERGLLSLNAPGADTIRLELRVWQSRGLGGTNGLILRHDGVSWRAFRTGLDTYTNPHPAVDTLPDGAWHKVWAHVQRMGLLELSAFNGPNDGLAHTDGPIALIELREGAQYRSWTYQLLDPRSNSEMRRMVAILRYLRWQVP